MTPGILFAYPTKGSSTRHKTQGASALPMSRPTLRCTAFIILPMILGIDVLLPVRALMTLHNHSGAPMAITIAPILLGLRSSKTLTRSMRQEISFPVLGLGKAFSNQQVLRRSVAGVCLLERAYTCLVVVDDFWPFGYDPIGDSSCKVAVLSRGDVKWSPEVVDESFVCVWDPTKLRISLNSNSSRGIIEDIIRYGRFSLKRIFCGLYGFWEDLIWCKILPRGVGMICPYF